ncbi:E3 ubiquitin-protein ligase TRIM35-like [Syngnathoides biaculeatus]|uniref:E3 ubiquitin-protein ligase TRIM35-like n=1 Tax=Syngnathoides biaculeatus TaxID=300417 RepID=UPI002ADE02A3|nr:E3 ubiquitin-protein ligase TRIM35-like [Syngnathoides biaculeatus]XP_061669618.1 E3 ubiquitin-protein ligase TRIM35-like [Syngnathoides biaculeatus]XP_061669619.1 E3 ubiquitin-protein ligase TRIM35-like [Syngnathoides biaculeatus]
MAGQIEDDLQCPSCMEIFKEPVILPCSHSFCRSCVQRWWEERGDRTCPVCREKCHSTEPPLNLALRNVCEAFSKASLESRDVCKLHGEKVKLFCLDHQESACVGCRDSKLHAGHKLCPLDVVVQDCRKTLQEGLQRVKERLGELKNIRVSCSEQAEHIKVQAEQVERKIKKDFEELRGFLRLEEEAKLAAVREEAQRKSQMMKETMEALARDQAVLSDLIRTTEERLSSDQVSFMNAYQTAMSRIRQLPEKPKQLRAALLDEVKHVGNLKFTVWERMKEVVCFTPVILDPNTAGAALSLCQDLTSVSFKVRQQRPKNPERLKRSNEVLGRGLESGTHVWDVEVGDNADWELGVAWWDTCLPHTLFKWIIRFHNGEYKILSRPLGSQNLREKLQRIRVRVDTNEKSVSFSESLTKTELHAQKNIYNWPEFSGTMKMCPYFSTSNETPLKVAPLTIGAITWSE